MEGLMPELEPDELVYKIDDKYFAIQRTEEGYRDVRFRSYEKLRSEGKSVSIENYQQVYIGRIQSGKLRRI